MPSGLRRQISPEACGEAHQSIGHASLPPLKKQKMSLSQTYFVAASARTKLGQEACKADHNLRLLVGHANLLDALMAELHQAEREQEAWFNQTVQKAAKTEEPRHIQWMDTLADAPEEDDDAEFDAASDTSDESDAEEYSVPIPRRVQSSQVSITTQEAEEDEEFEDEEDDEEHALVRTASSPPHSPPELDLDSDSDDESAPNSPPHFTMLYSEQQRQAIATTAFFDQKSAAPLPGTDEMNFTENDYFLPEGSQAPLVAAF